MYYVNIDCGGNLYTVHADRPRPEGCSESLLKPKRELSANIALVD